jgi:hypothetical protein
LRTKLALFFHPRKKKGENLQNIFIFSPFHAIANAFSLNFPLTQRLLSPIASRKSIAKPLPMPPNRLFVTIIRLFLRNLIPLLHPNQEADEPE